MAQIQVIAHRGASGYRPEHTLDAYTLAIEQGADVIEPDLVMTKDHVLIARHDVRLDETTNVASHPQFAGRRVTKQIHGKPQTGWFVEDFTVREIKQLRARERRWGDPPAPFRPDNVRFDDQFEIPTLVEVIDLAKSRGVGIYPETKQPTHLAATTGGDVNEVLLHTLEVEGVRTMDDLPTYIQSFEVGNLRGLHQAMSTRGLRFELVQLLGARGQPFDIVRDGGRLTYAQMATAEGLREIATYADGVGPEKNHFVIPLDADGQLRLDSQTTFVEQAHDAGLFVHPYTFRAENRSLPGHLRGKAPQDPHQLGNLPAEIDIFLQAGIDGFFTDHPDLGRQAVER